MCWTYTGCTTLFPQTVACAGAMPAGPRAATLSLLSHALFGPAAQLRDMEDQGGSALGDGVGGLGVAIMDGLSCVREHGCGIFVSCGEGNHRDSIKATSRPQHESRVSKPLRVSVSVSVLASMADMT